MKLKVGDVLVEVNLVDRRRELTVTKVGRKWADTPNGRVSAVPNANGLVRCADTYSSGTEIYVSHHAADVAKWKRKAITAVRKRIEWANASAFSVETLEAALALFGIEHAPAPKVTP